MRRLDHYLGGLLIAAGILFLLRNLGFLPVARHFAVIVFFGLGGLAFLAVFLQDRGQWWALIPGCALLSLAAVILAESIPPLADWGGTIFLAGMGAAFWLIRLVTGPANWWAVIPGGALWTLAATAAADSIFPDKGAGAVFFLGLAATFGLVYLLPTPSGRMRWAAYPAAALGLLGATLASAAADLARFIWPSILILAGLFLLYRTIVPRRD